MKFDFLLLASETISSKDTAKIWFYVMAMIVCVTTVVTVAVYRFNRHEQKIDMKKVEVDLKQEELRIKREERQLEETKLAQLDLEINSYQPGPTE